jgi:nicotinamide-nucleotide amidase
MDREPLHSASDADLRELAERAGRALLTRRWRVVTAESCTAGWVAKALTDISGSSQWLECGYVTYSNAAKARDLHVPPEVLTEHGAVSEETVRAMAWGALQVSGADLAVAISGIAGPDGGLPGKPVGTVWFGVAYREDPQPRDLSSAEDDPVVTSAQLRLFAGDRDQVRRQSVGQALQLVLDALGDASLPGAQVG